MRDGGCVPSVYPIPPESFKVEVEEGNATEATDGGLPEGVKQTGLVKLDNSTVRQQTGAANWPCQTRQQHGKATVWCC